MTDIVWILVIFFFIEVCMCDDLPCALRQAQFGGVCVCNSSYCDTIERPPPLAKGLYYRYTTSNDTPGFHKTTGYFAESTMLNNSIVFTINPSIQYQEILGFGGSFTDSAGMAVNSLPSEVQDKFMQSYFGIDGIEYTMGRVPIGMSDFSTRMYSYDEVPNDDDMANFTLVDEDYKYKIPVIQKAMSVSPHKLKLVGCAFTSPPWMKTSNAVGTGYIKKDHLHAWAKYHVKFLDSYANYSIPFWALTGGNQLILLLLYPKILPMGLMDMPYSHRRWLRDHLAPQLDSSNHSNVKFFIMDDVRPFGKYWLSRFAMDPEAYERIEGVAFHWYFDWFANASWVDEMHRDHPEKIIMYTESSINTVLFGGQAVELGSWDRALYYAFNIIENINHWASGYLDWNLALNTDGGPYLKLSIDSPIIVNTTGQEFYKNPMFYVMGHFSKFIPPGSKRVDVQTSQKMPQDIKRMLSQEEIIDRITNRLNSVKDTVTTEAPKVSKVIPFPTPIPVPKTVSCMATVNSDESSTVVVLNGMDSDVNVTIIDTVSGYIDTTIAANSINTFVYWPEI